MSETTHNETRCNDMPSAECPHCGSTFRWDDYYELEVGEERECPRCEKTIFVTEVDVVIRATLSTHATS